MDTIDLDAILKKIGSLPGHRGEGEYTKACIREAIHQVSLYMYTEEQVIEMMTATVMNIHSSDIYTIQELKDEFPNVFEGRKATSKRIFEKLIK